MGTQMLRRKMLLIERHWVQSRRYSLPSASGIEDGTGGRPYVSNRNFINLIYGEGDRLRAERRGASAVCGVQLTR